MNEAPVELDIPQFTISKVASGAAVQANTIRTWYQRGHLRLAETDRAADVNGLAHLLSLRTALRIATMAALVKQGFDPASACRAAMVWTDLGGSFLGEPDRNPAMLFNEPHSILCCYSGGITILKHMPPRRSAADIFFGPGPMQRAVTAIRLEDVDQQVRRVLNPHPQPL